MIMNDELGNMWKWLWPSWRYYSSFTWKDGGKPQNSSL